jgi:hypothetical protein
MTGRDIRETLGFLGVMASLVFVGMEIRQNTRVARAEAYRALAEMETAAMLASATNPQLAGLMRRVVFDGALRDAFSDSEKYQLGTMYDYRITNLELVYRQVEEGVLPPTALEMQLSALFGTPYLRELWPLIREQYDAGFAAYFEDRYGVPR